MGCHGVEADCAYGIEILPVPRRYLQPFQQDGIRESGWQLLELDVRAGVVGSRSASGAVRIEILFLEYSWYTIPGGFYRPGKLTARRPEAARLSLPGEPRCTPICRKNSPRLNGERPNPPKRIRKISSAFLSALPATIALTIRGRSSSRKPAAASFAILTATSTSTTT